MDPGTPEAALKRGSCLGKLTAGLYVLLLLAALAEGIFSYADLHQPPSYRTQASQHWDMVSLTMVGVFALAGGTALFYLMKRHHLLWIAALCLSFITLAGVIQMFMAGLVVLAETKHRGGDWGGLNVVAGGLFNLGVPVLLGVITLAGLACLMLLRPASQPAPPLS